MVKLRVKSYNHAYIIYVLILDEMHINELITLDKSHGITNTYCFEIFKSICKRKAVLRALNRHIL